MRFYLQVTVTTKTGKKKEQREIHGGIHTPERPKGSWANLLVGSPTWPEVEALQTGEGTRLICWPKRLREWTQLQAQNFLTLLHFQVPGAGTALNYSVFLSNLNSTETPASSQRQTHAVTQLESKPRALSVVAFQPDFLLIALNKSYFLKIKLLNYP